MRGEIQVASANLDAGRRRLRPLSLRVLDVHVDDFVRNQRETVADRVFISLQIKAVAGIPNHAEVRRIRQMAPELSGLGRIPDERGTVIVQEDPDGHRVLNDAVRIWPAASGRRPEQLGWPRIDVHYTPGTRMPEGGCWRMTVPAGSVSSKSVLSC